MTSSRSLFAVLMAIVLTTFVFAQVSPQSPAPDSAVSITVEGRISKVEFTAPHVTLYVDVADADSQKFITWAIETGSLTELSSKGVKLSDLKVGRVVRAKGTPASGKNKLEVPASEIFFPH